MINNKIRVLIVDDSALIKEALSSILSSDQSIEVIGQAKDGKEAVAKAKALKPDVITMDLKMPEMSGLEATEKIMEDSPTPIIIVSSMNAKVIIQALGVGARDFVAIDQEIEDIGRDLIEKVKIASKVKPLRHVKIKPRVAPKLVKKERIQKVVAIGVSTGGPQALKVVLSKLPSDFQASILIVQHMSKGIIHGLADWLRISSSLDIRVAMEGNILKNSTVFLAPDDYHIKTSDKGIISLSKDTYKTTSHTPSIDTMMKSVASSYKEDVIEVIMTGMGRDGIKGMCAIKNAGGITIAQDEETSAVFGMNKISIEKGCIDKIVPLEKIALEIIRAL